jgi:hypothetical protein
MIFTAPYSPKLPSPFELKINHSNTILFPQLDGTGFCCIAFIETSPEKLRSKIKNAGFDTTESEYLLVNGKVLTVFFAIGQNGEIVEIISLNNTQ